MTSLNSTANQILIKKSDSLKIFKDEFLKSKENERNPSKIRGIEFVI